MENENVKKSMNFLNFWEEYYPKSVNNRMQSYVTGPKCLIMNN